MRFSDFYHDAEVFSWYIVESVTLEHEAEDDVMLHIEVKLAGVQETVTCFMPLYSAWICMEKEVF